MIWSVDCKQFQPETPILNNWELIKFLLPRISPIPNRRGRGGRGMKQNLTEFNVAISWNMISERNWCLTTQFFDIYAFLKPTATVAEAFCFQHLENSNTPWYWKSSNKKKQINLLGGQTPTHPPVKTKKYIFFCFFLQFTENRILKTKQFLFLAHTHPPNQFFSSSICFGTFPLCNSYNFFLQFFFLKRNAETKGNLGKV